MKPLREVEARYQARRAEARARDEARARWLLGRWVSEIEPQIARIEGEVVGLTWEGAGGVILWHPDAQAERIRRLFNAEPFR